MANEISIQQNDEVLWNSSTMIQNSLKVLNSVIALNWTLKFDDHCSLKELADYIIQVDDQRQKTKS